MNEFVDMHVHSKFSIDGMSTMEDYCLIAGKTGTRVICFTEHVDFNSAEKNLSIVKDNRKQNFVVDDYFREINRLRKKYGSLTLLKVSEMPEKLSICRAKGIAFLGILLQSESQLKRMYGENEAIEIMDNCDTYVFFGGNNFETARSLSLKLNVPLDEILYLPVGQIVVLRRGHKPVFSTRFDVFNDEFYQKIANGNIYTF